MSEMRVLRTAEDRVRYVIEQQRALRGEVARFEIADIESLLARCVAAEQALAEIASYNERELREDWNEENAADMVAIARAALAGSGEQPANQETDDA